MSNIINSVAAAIVDENGKVYRSIRKLSNEIGVNRDSISKMFKKNGFFKFKGMSYYLMNDATVRIAENKASLNVEATAPAENASSEVDKEYEEFLKSKEAKQLPFERYEFKPSTRTGKGSRYAVALFSDAHIEETVKPSSVLGLNEYNIFIAKERIERYFVNLAACINEDGVRNLIFASLGDTISGYIHDELAQTNSLSPLEATLEAQNLLYNGMCYLCENTNLSSIHFIGIVGNHSRTTKKIQHSNGYKLSYEWIMYQNLKRQCEIAKLPIEFSIPESEMAFVEAEDGKKFIFIHGFQIKSTGSGTVCGIYPALNRLSMKWDKTFKQDKIYLGHFHTCVSIPNATVNGSIIGFNSFSLTNGFTYEEPAQMYEVYDSEIGLMLTRKIYCK